MIVLIDNYDSFSYNLYQLIGTLHPDIRVVRNDELTVKQVRELHPSHVILSPGPGYPRDAGICVEAAKNLGTTSRCWAFASAIRRFARPSAQRSATPSS